MLIITSKQLDKHCIWACGEVAFNYLGNFLKLRHYLAIERSSLKVDSDICACAEAQYFWIDIITRTCDDVHVDHALYALMDGRTRHSTLNGDVLGSNARIAYDDVKNTSVEIIYFFHVFAIYFSEIRANIHIIFENNSNFP